MLGSGKPDLLRRSEQAHTVTRTAELARQVAGEVEALCAAQRFGGQLCGALVGCDRDVAGPAIRCPLRGSVQLLCDCLIGSGCGRSAVPDGAVGFIGQCLSEGSVRAAKLVGRRRLLHRRDDQRVPEPKSS
jgi:hypothetical protein